MAHQDHLHFGHTPDGVLQNGVIQRMHTLGRDLSKRNSATDMRMHSPGGDCILGIDLGATFLRIARVDAAGGEFFSIATPSSSEAEEVLSSAVRKVSREQQICCVGLSRAPGLDEHGHVAEWPSRPDWAQLPLIPWLRRAANAPVVSADDGVCAVVSEHRLRGDVAGRAVTACISIGTGLAVGIVDGNRVLPTGDGASTLSHERFGSLDFPCRCGRRGCLQTGLSVQGLEKIMAAGKILDLQIAFEEFLGVLKSRYNVDTVIVTGGGVVRFGTQFLLQNLVNSKCDALTLRISNAPEFSGIGGALLLATEHAARNKDVRNEFWERRVVGVLEREAGKQTSSLSFAQAVTS